MKVFVTGGTGFIGSHFIRQALGQGIEIVALRRSPASRPRVDLAVQPQWVDASLEAIRPEWLHGCDAVVHLAAHTPNVPYDTLENCIQWNVLAPLVLFRTAMNIGIERFVVAGSCFEYGRSGERYEFIPPDAPLEPTQTYPASKAMASIAFGQLAQEFKLRLSIHRIFQVFGEGEAEGRLWPSLRKAAIEGRDFEMTPSEQVRDFISVNDVAKKLVGACLREVMPGSLLVENIGTGRPQSLKSFAEKCWHEWGGKGRLIIGKKLYRKGEVMRYVPLIEPN